MTEEELAQFEAKLDALLEENHNAFVGEYKEQIDGLLGLSRAEIDEITLDSTDLETYDKLITIVREASRVNLAQADLKNQILKLGEVGISIAKQVPKLAALFI